MTIDTESDWVRDVLARRTKTLARARSLGATAHEAVVLSVAGESFAIRPRDVVAVAALERVTPLPHAPMHVLGLATFGGAIVPVFHLFAVLGVPLGALSEHARMVMLGGGDDTIALAVNDVRMGTIEPPFMPLPDTMSASLQSLCQGADRNGLVILDASAVLASALLRIDIAPPRGDSR